MAIRSILTAVAATLITVAPIAADAQDSGSQDEPTAENVVPATVKSGPDTEWQIKPRWRLQYDVATVEGPDGLTGRETFSGIRRARLGVDIDIPAGVSARIDGEFQDETIQLLDVYLAWQKHDFLVIAGQQKAIDPLDLHSSNLHTSFLERPAFYTAFNYGRGTGVLLGYERENIGVYGGVFTEPLAMLNDVKSNSISADFRAYWSPRVGDARFHLGGSFHRRDMNDLEREATRYRLRPAVRITDIRYIGTPGLQVNKETRYGAEVAGVWRRLHAAGEIHWLEANRSALDDLRFFGGYAEVGLFLTDDSRPLRRGAFGAIKPKRPLADGGLGAVQLNMRYDYLDLNSRDVVGGRQNGYLASLIWTPVDFVRLMASYARLDYSDAVIAAGGRREYSVDVLAMRFQISY